MTTETDVLPYKHADFTCSNCELIQELSFEEVGNLTQGNHVACPKCNSQLQLQKAERDKLLAQIDGAGGIGKIMAIGGMVLFAATAVLSIIYGAIAGVVCIGISIAFFALMNARRTSIPFLQLVLKPTATNEPLPSSASSISG
ncbi:MAG: hypothetical protein ACN6O6_13890 [Pseudomonas sp.]|uniref:hypothetical protein n=1 Tax=Pseudomonas sp. TaxID=306 RepID=UPI003D0E83D4